MEALIQDLRFGLRMLVKSPGFTLAAIVALALGIGANAAIFSVVNTILLRAPNLPDPDRLVVPFSTTRGGSGRSFSYPDYRDYRDQTEAFSGLVGRAIIHVALGQGGQNELIWGEIVTGNYFSVLGVTPALGRGFLEEEDRTEGSHPVVVLSHSLWRDRFHSDARIVGSTVALNGRDFTVIGVAPEGFPGTEFALAMDLWVPVMMHQVVMPGNEGILEGRNDRWMELVGRLKPGVSVQQADAAMQVVAERLSREHSGNRGLGVTVVPERQGRFPLEASGPIALGAGLALVVVGLVLLIACANVANLLLARAAARRREIGLRLALGAGRLRLLRQLLTESLILAVLGGACGLLLATWVSDLLLAFRPPIPYTLAIDYAPDGRVLAFTMIVSLLTALVFGLAPALHASRPDLVLLLKAEGGSRRAAGRRPMLGTILVAGQVTLSLVVLVGAGLFLRSLANAGRIDPGFETENVALGTFDLALLNYTEDRGRAFYSELVRRVEALPGVVAAGFLSNLPLDTNWTGSGPILADGQPEPSDGRGLSAEVGVVTPGLFRALGVEILRGRGFTEHDDAGDPAVTVINETLAARLWPGEDPIGKRLRIGGAAAPPRVVIGLARDGKYHTLGESPQSFIYRPVGQAYRSEMSLLVRVRSAPEGILEAVREEVRSLDARLPVYGLKTMEEHMGYALWWTRMGATLASIFGLLALALAAVGLYGVLSYSVSRRTREFGIRMALGARPRDLERQVVGGGLAVTLVGVAGGLVLASVLGTIMASILYGVRPVEPGVLAGLGALLCLVAIVASWIPAHRAARIDPMVALRTE